MDLSISEVVDLSPDIQKVFSTAMASERVVQLAVNPLAVKTDERSESPEPPLPPPPKIWYSIGCFRALVSVEGSGRIQGLHDTSAEVMSRHSGS